MRTIQISALVGLMLATTPAAGQQIGPADAFTQLKSLLGTWDVTERDNPNTKEVATYSMTGGGRVLAEDLRAPEGKANEMGHMYTTYHMDNGKLVLTHFCGAGNQPRMRATSIEDGGKKIGFEMYDITNLATPESFRSNAVDVIFVSKDRVDLVYHGIRGPAGSIKSEQVFQLTRRKTSV